MILKLILNCECVLFFLLSLICKNLEKLGRLVESRLLIGLLRFAFMY